MNSFESLAEESRPETIALAARLSSLGIGEADVVLFQAHQCASASALFWATMRIGAIFMPVDAEWPRYLLERATARIRPKAIAAFEPQLDTLRTLFGDASVLALNELEEPRQDSTVPPRSAGHFAPESAAAYLFTSGSTGVPKVVVLSRGALAHGAALTVRTFGWQDQETLLNLPELHTMSGLRNALVAAPMGNLTWVPCPPSARSNLFQLLEAIETSRCDHLVAGPALIRQMVLAGSRVERDALAQLKAIYCTGATLSPSAVEAFHARYGIPIVNYYGLTETGGICISQNRFAWTPADRSLGRAVGCSARLATNSGTHDTGELQINSPQLMSGYLGDPERTAARFDQGWLRTGDIMRQDEEGNFYLLGRADLFIKSATTDRIHPEEVETVLEEHPAVAEAAVSAREDAHGTERVVAAVVLRDAGAASDPLSVELAQFVAGRLGSARRPSEIRFIERLPRLSSGKLERAKLKELVS